MPENTRHNSWRVCGNAELERRYKGHFGESTIHYIEGDIKLLSSMAERSYNLDLFVAAIRRIITTEGAPFWQPLLVPNGFLTMDGDLSRRGFLIFFDFEEAGLRLYNDYLTLCSQSRQPPVQTNGVQPNGVQTNGVH